ncbi:MAG TPA: recombinase family protein [Spirochaetales bacterium]|nr:recombinase family protein [Spirochaetales bacterium]
MIAAYIRKSPDDKKESDKIENQRKVILGYAKSNGLTISEDAFQKNHTLSV